MASRYARASEAMRKVILQLDYYLGGQFAGLATGLARGMFASRGLDV